MRLSAETDAFCLKRNQHSGLKGLLRYHWTMESRVNRRGKVEHYVKRRHLKLQGLKLEAERFGLENRYLQAGDIPEYPKPEFHASLLKHDTNGSALRGIRRDGGFRNPFGGPLIWWSLAVGPEEMKDAETRLLETALPDRKGEDSEQRSFLWRFANSPAFKETSRLGSYRFTFPLQEVLTAYSQQFCSGSQPTMRVYETVLYKQEVMHVVLVQSLAKQTPSRCPLLTDDRDAVCVYKDGRFIWRPEAMCEKHWWELIRGDGQQLEARRVAEDRPYVWDHVAVALDVGKTQVLRFDAGRLRSNLTYCLPDEVNYAPKEQVEVSFDDAKTTVKDLWVGWNGPLEMESSLLQRLTVSDLQLVLVGWPAVGKSSSGNAILGRSAFRTGAAAASASVQRVCVQRGRVFSGEVTIIDTPPLPESSAPQVREELFRCLALSGSAPLAVLLVVRLGFLTSHAEETAERLEETFGGRVWSRTLILLTYQDRTRPDLQNRAGPDLQNLLQRNGGQLQLLFQRVGTRFQVLNIGPAQRDVQQVWDLLQEVKDMLVHNMLE